MLGIPMDVRPGDVVKVRATPEVDPALWDHLGRVVDLTEEAHLLVELDTGEDCTFLPDQLVVHPATPDAGQGPFDIFPGPGRQGP